MEIANLKKILWGQFGAAIDMLENSIKACPEELWADRGKQPEYWYIAYHTLFWLDLYLSDSGDDFTPPAPFGLEELDPAGVIPERPYSKRELLKYLEHGRKKCRATIETLTGEKAVQIFKFGTIELNYGELLLYNLRHVQHGAAQLNFILRQEIDSAPRWVRKTESTIG